MMCRKHGHRATCVQNDLHPTIPINYNITISKSTVKLKVCDHDDVENSVRGTGTVHQRQQSRSLSVGLGLAAGTT